uniref:Uncharacterized protein n=1 Tax=Salix viminalis TaxID=40686 RepID=A0A6N2L316_SALVM
MDGLVSYKNLQRQSFRWSIRHQLEVVRFEVRTGIMILSSSKISHVFLLHALIRWWKDSDCQGNEICKRSTLNVYMVNVSRCHVFQARIELTNISMIYYRRYFRCYGTLDELVAHKVITVSDVPTESLLFCSDVVKRSCEAICFWKLPSRRVPEEWDCDSGVNVFCSHLLFGQGIARKCKLSTISQPSIIRSHNSSSVDDLEVPRIKMGMMDHTSNATERKRRIIVEDARNQVLEMISDA